MSRVNWITGQVSIEADVTIEQLEELGALNGLITLKAEATIDDMKAIHTQMQNRVMEIITGGENTDQLKVVAKAAAAIGIELDLSAETIGEVASLFEPDA